MFDEITTLIRNGTWALVPPSSSQNVVECKCVFQLKHHPDGSISKYKVCLVAKGFHQRPGLDFHETFNPVVKPITIRLILTLALSNGWPLCQLDVNNVFLCGTLIEDVFMQQIVDQSKQTFVCKLHKAIYGLKQASRAWYNELKGFLLSYGFVNSHSVASLFIYHVNAITLYFLVYVDDLIVIGDNSSFLTHFLQALSTRFSVKDLGDLHYFLGIEVISTKASLLLTQHKYIRDLL